MALTRELIYILHPKSEILLCHSFKLPLSVERAPVHHVDEDHVAAEHSLYEKNRPMGFYSSFPSHKAAPFPLLWLGCNHVIHVQEQINATWNRSHILKPHRYVCSVLDSDERKLSVDGVTIQLDLIWRSPATLERDHTLLTRDSLVGSFMVKNNTNVPSCGRGVLLTLKSRCRWGGKPGVPSTETVYTDYTPSSVILIRIVTLYSHYCSSSTSITASATGFTQSLPLYLSFSDFWDIFIIYLSGIYHHQITIYLEPGLHNTAKSLWTPPGCHTFM